MTLDPASADQLRTSLAAVAWDCRADILAGWGLPDGESR